MSLATQWLPLLALLLTTDGRDFDKSASSLASSKETAPAEAGADAPADAPSLQLPPPPYAHRPHRLTHIGSLIRQLEGAAAEPGGGGAAAPGATTETLPYPVHPLHSAHQHALQPPPPHDADLDASEYYDDEDDDDDYDLDEEYGDVDDVHPDHVLGPPWELPQGHEPRGMSPISQTKWETMGTRGGVDELRRSRFAAGAKTLTAMPGFSEAVDHLLRVNRDGDCKVPKPRLVQVKHEYPHPSKIYLPRCTILHQCGDDTGCCKAESLTCVPRQAHRVDLFFYTSTVGPAGPSSLQRVERLSFYNHTECGCVDRNSEALSRGSGGAGSGSVGGGGAGQALRAAATRGLFQSPLQVRHERAPQVLSSCRCPSKYAVRPTNDGACICDCFDKHRECLRLKKGKEYFSTHDRQCIQKSECKVPTCEFGSYLRLAGRCPKKRERFEAWNQ